MITKAMHELPRAHILELLLDPAVAVLLGGELRAPALLGVQLLAPLLVERERARALLLARLHLLVLGFQFLKLALLLGYLLS